ncbi:MAG: OmpA family protein [Bacteroidetes bacterium]|nr:OmpA family protein [Bacteroidota bacterium]
MLRIAAILLLLPTLLIAQSTNISTAFMSTFKKAELYHSQFAYRNALTLYEHVVEEDPSNHAAREGMADCYFRLGQTEKAEKAYKELASIKDADPKYKYQYAQILSMQGKYADAKQWFGEYLNANQNDPWAKEKLEFFNDIDYYFRDSLLYEVGPEPYNSNQSDFAPQYFKNDVVFVSTRNRDIFLKIQSLAAINETESMVSIFLAPGGTAGENEVSLFHKHGLHSSYHDGPVAFFNHYKQVAFSRNNLAEGKPVAKDGRVNLELYFADVSQENEITGVESFPYNNDAYSIGHPWVSEDGGILYFASNMPGGFGGADLYKCEMEGGKWSKPVNLGSTINTIGDEFYPFLLNDSTLFFSSNGHGGLGGLDQYSVYLGKTSSPIPRNLGYPLNTSYDDFAMVLDPTGRKGMFSSNRPGGKGYDDIYHFSVRSFFLEGHVVDRMDTSSFINDAEILIINEKGILVDSLICGTEGRFRADLPFDQDFTFKASKQGYSFVDEVRLSTKARSLGHGRVRVPLWKHSLFAKGFVYSNESQGRLQNATVILENLTDNRKDSLITNETDPYNFLVEPNKKYRIIAHKEGFLPLEIHMNTQGLYHGDLLNDFLLEEEFIDKVVIQFDYDKSHIRETETGKLDELYRILRKRPHAVIHISAFADTQGTREYNQGLSDRRADAALRYFEQRGIAPSRIMAKGFGETLILNHCSEGVECPEEEHAKNRRAELKVQQEH